MAYISIILNIVLGIWSVYLYLENRKLKGFKIERDIKLKELQMTETGLERDKRSLPYVQTLCGGMDIFEEKTYEVKIAKLKTEVDYLEKLKNYKWIFGKKK